MRFLFIDCKKRKAELIFRAMAAGVEKRGHTAEYRTSPFWYERTIVDAGEDDVCVFYGVTGETKTAWDGCEFTKTKRLYVDNGYFSSTWQKDDIYEAYFRVTHDAPQINLKNCKWVKGRAAEIGVSVIPWRGFDSAKPAIIVPQTKKWYEMHDTTYEAWLMQADSIARNMPCAGVSILGQKNDSKIRVKSWASIASGIVTHSSAAAFECIVQGVPAVSTSPISAAHGFDDTSIEGRTEFADKLCSNQWRLDEFVKGDWLDVVF
jgi:hypothetical protein